uniref:hypothetical protein n=1 Tax=Zhouia sp. PK063 TaxID=3373602 RepID=UPI0037DCE6FA
MRVLLWCFLLFMCKPCFSQAEKMVADSIANYTAQFCEKSYLPFTKNCCTKKCIAYFTKEKVAEICKQRNLYQGEFEKLSYIETKFFAKGTVYRYKATYTRSRYYATEIRIYVNEKHKIRRISFLRWNDDFK